jgi:hypothetical protein
MAFSKGKKSPTAKKVTPKQPSLFGKKIGVKLGTKKTIARPPVRSGYVSVIGHRRKLPGSGS